MFRDLVVGTIDPASPAVEPNQDLAEVAAMVARSRGDYAVLSASCDVDGRRKHPFVLLGRVLAANETNVGASGKDFSQRLEVIRQGLDPAKFLLPKHPRRAPPFPLSIVQHSVLALLPEQYLRRHCVAPRLRLRHPFREKFGNWVGSNFSRVGPEDESLIPRIAQIFAGHVVATAENP